jgi:predicted MPP superfamily phosphohydrolase
LDGSRKLGKRAACAQRAGFLSVGWGAFVAEYEWWARPDVWISGIDDPYTGIAKPDAALAGIPSGAYTILLFHSPGYFGHVAGRANLCLAGHTHGGQVRLPLTKPLWMPRGSGHFLEGWYEESGTKMYVSRGIGTSILPIRFFCRPEIAFISVEP